MELGQGRNNRSIDFFENCVGVSTEREKKAASHWSRALQVLPTQTIRPMGIKNKYSVT